MISCKSSTFFPSFISPNIEVEAKQDHSLAGQLDLSRDSHNPEPDKTSSCDRCCQNQVCLIENYYFQLSYSCYYNNFASHCMQNKNKYSELRNFKCYQLYFWQPSSGLISSFALYDVSNLDARRKPANRLHTLRSRIHAPTPTHFARLIFFALAGSLFAG